MHELAHGTTIMAAREYRRAAERRHRVRFASKREQAARVESMQSPSSVTGFYDDYPATKCDYWTESAHGAGWLGGIRVSDQRDSISTRGTTRIQVGGRRALKQFFPSLSLPLILSFAPNVPLHFIAFARAHVYTPLSVRVTDDR